MNKADKGFIRNKIIKGEMGVFWIVFKYAGYYIVVGMPALMNGHQLARRIGLAKIFL